MCHLWHRLHGGIQSPVANREPLAADVVFAKETIEVRPAVAGELDGCADVAVRTRESFTEHCAFGFVSGLASFAAHAGLRQPGRS